MTPLPSAALRGLARGADADDPDDLDCEDVLPPYDLAGDMSTCADWLERRLAMHSSDHLQVGSTYSRD
jgi:hypothetical protein